MLTFKVAVLLCIVSTSLAYVIGPGIWAGSYGGFPQYGGGFQAPYYGGGGGFYDDQQVHVHYHEPSYRQSSGFGNLFGGISQRDLVAGTTGVVLGSLLSRRQQG